MAEENATAAAEEYYRLINAGGNHYDIGRKMTDAFTDKLHKRLSEPIDSLKAQNAARSAEAVFEFHPVLKDELQGIAEGISIEIEAMLVEANDYGAPPTHSMTVVAKEGDSLLVGRSFSASPATYVRNLLRLDPNDSYASLGRMSGYFAGTWESYGVYGQFVSADILSGNKEPRDGVAAYMVPRIITESSKSVESAVEKLSSLKPMHESSYLLAGAEGTHIFTFQNGKMEHEEIDTLPLLLVDGRRVDSPAVAGGLDGIKALLSGHSGGGCLHTAEFETLYATVADMKAEEIAYTNGPPCSSQFNSVDWPGGYG